MGVKRGPKKGGGKGGMMMDPTQMPMKGKGGGRKGGGKKC